MGFKQVESISMSLGGNPAHRTVYIYSIAKNGSVVKQGKSMEIITITILGLFRRIHGLI